ncbi:RICIN domain-containing protein [Nocardiopsis changdeensis]|uniref:RICIN domain-containing protein n=1 Tax=Nocardiopsis changdeensis TaxID=2831969 RepID=A0ABX8BV21_9ACTN|nr:MULTISPECIES: RICIN domain-containing protein [Nocardiopsis]QUX24636.1 RICIN domain-containing protein [Nocardiopsis changdeensis]QYX35025.1 RICIN domain-containing protein [Nocardiopsis sp. MT53]
MSRSRRSDAPRAATERYIPHWPVLAGATALVLIAAILGYVGGLFASDSARAEEGVIAVSGVLVQPAEPEESPEPSPEPSEEPTHPAGIDPETVYVLQNVHGGRVLDVAQAATGNGAAVHLWDRHDQANQQWRFAPVEGGFYEITGVGSGKVLEVPADAAAQAAATLLTSTGATNQHWTVVDAGGGVVRLVNRATGQALEGQGGAPDNGTPVVQAPDGGHAFQQWRLVPLG